MVWWVLQGEILRLRSRLRLRDQCAEPPHSRVESCVALTMGEEAMLMSVDCESRGILAEPQISYTVAHTPHPFMSHVMRRSHNRRGSYVA